jgi:hypothetical protein
MSEDTVMDPVADLDTKKAKAKAELAAAKQHADSIGAKYHHRAGIEKVKEAIAKREEEMQAEAEPKAEAERLEESQDDSIMRELVTELNPAYQRQLEKQVEEAKRQNLNRLVRIRIQCMNPAKRDWPGEIISVGSAKYGTFKKFVPYGSDEPYHVPYWIFQELKDRKCRIGVTTKNRYGHETTRHKIIPEYAIEELPPLTPQELKELGQRQAMASGTAEQ